MGEQPNAPVDSGTAPETSAPGPEATPQEVSINPAWDPVLSTIPQSLHPGIVPHLKKWDDNYRQLETSYAPFKDLSKNGVTPDHVAEALQVREVLLNNPRFLYDRMVQQFGKEWGVAEKPLEETPQQQDVQTDFGDDFTQNPKFQEVVQQNQVIAQYLLAQEEAKKAAEEDAALEEEWQGITSKYPHLRSEDHERVIFSVASQQGLPLEQVIDWYVKTPGGQAPTQRIPAPQVMPTSGGVPAQNLDVGKLSAPETRHLVADYIKALRG